MNSPHLRLTTSPALSGEVTLSGAKNAVLVIMASLVLTRGISRLFNVPSSADVHYMIALLEQLGARVSFSHDDRALEVDTTFIDRYYVSPDLMNKMRASVLVMGPLLARFGRADIALPGGCVIGARPIDYHLAGFARMGVLFEQEGALLHARVEKKLEPALIFLDYPSVGATENCLMAATATAGTTRIINAALEPEVFDLIAVLIKMGARISIKPAATIEIEGGYPLVPIEHTVMPDRLEAGALLLAAAITGGFVSLPQAPIHFMELFLFKLEQMGHTIIKGNEGASVTLVATKKPRAVSFKTGPYPAFPTDLQAPMMAAQLVAQGNSTIHETVFENRLHHVSEFKKMGAQLNTSHGFVSIDGVDRLHGAQVEATDIRASCGLVLAGLKAEGETIVTGIHHWKRGYDGLEHKLAQLGAPIALIG